jgi:arabinan endo-1,5-alpha-L-arabinosidase
MERHSGTAPELTAKSDSGSGAILLSEHGNINGPGGQTVFPDTDGDIFAYHYYYDDNSGDPALGINLISRTPDGWPYLQ